MGGAVNVTINCGGVAVRPGELVLADESGVVVIPPGESEAHIRRARQMQAEERLLLARLRAGETLADITRAA